MLTDGYKWNVIYLLWSFWLSLSIVSSVAATMASLLFLEYILPLALGTGFSESKTLSLNGHLPNSHNTESSLSCYFLMSFIFNWTLSPPAFLVPLLWFLLVVVFLTKHLPPSNLLNNFYVYVFMLWVIVVLIISSCTKNQTPQKQESLFVQWHFRNLDQWFK